MTDLSIFGFYVLLTGVCIGIIITYFLILICDYYEDK